MSETNGDYGADAPAVDGEEEVTGGFFASIIDIIIDPVKVFRRIDLGLAWWKPFLLIAIIQVVVQFLMMPYNRQAQIISLQERGLSAAQIEQQVAQLEQFGWIQPLFAPLGILVFSLLIAGLVHLSISMMSTKANYKKTLGLVIFCMMISTLAQVITLVIVKMKGIDAIQSASDLYPSLSLNAVFTESGGLLFALFETFSLFSIWFFILITVGVATIFKLSYQKSIIPTIIVGIISFLIAYVFMVKLGGLG